MLQTCIYTTHLRTCKETSKKKHVHHVFHGTGWPVLSAHLSTRSPSVPRTSRPTASANERGCRCLGLWICFTPEINIFPLDSPSGFPSGKMEKILSKSRDFRRIEQFETYTLTDMDRNSEVIIKEKLEALFQKQPSISSIGITSSPVISGPKLGQGAPSLSIGQLLLEFVHGGSLPGARQPLQRHDTSSTHQGAGPWAEPQVADLIMSDIGCCRDYYKI